MVISHGGIRFGAQEVVTTGWAVGTGEESMASEPKWSLSSRISASAKSCLCVSSVMMNACSVGLRMVWMIWQRSFDFWRFCYLPQDPATGGSRGFGFVGMEKDAAVNAINEFDGCKLDGRVIRVNEAQPKTRPTFNEDYA
jgi:RNA recognition motif-containing protein